MASTRSSGWASKAALDHREEALELAQDHRLGQRRLGADLVVDGLPAHADPLGEPRPSSPRPSPTSVVSSDRGATMRSRSRSEGWSRRHPRNRRPRQPPRGRQAGSAVDSGTKSTFSRTPQSGQHQSSGIVGPGRAGGEALVLVARRRPRRCSRSRGSARRAPPRRLSRTRRRPRSAAAAARLLRRRRTSPGSGRACAGRGWRGVRSPSKCASTRGSITRRHTAGTMREHDHPGVPGRQHRRLLEVAQRLVAPGRVGVVVAVPLQVVEQHVGRDVVGVPGVRGVDPLVALPLADADLLPQHPVVLHVVDDLEQREADDRLDHEVRAGSRRRARRPARPRGPPTSARR